MGRDFLEKDNVRTVTFGFLEDTTEELARATGRMREQAAVSIGSVRRYWYPQLVGWLEGGESTLAESVGGYVEDRGADVSKSG